MTTILVTRILPSAHKGDLAIAIAMLERLRRDRPRWELSLVCHDAARDEDIFRRYGAVHAALFPAVDEASPARKLWRLLRYLLWGGLGFGFLDRAGHRFRRSCLDAQVMVFCGGGSPGGYGLVNLLLHAAVPLLFARRTGTPVVFTGLGVEPVTGVLHRRVMCRVLSAATRVIARDAVALQTLRELGVTSPCELGADWALDLEAEAAENVEHVLAREGVGRTRPLRVVINLRDVLASGPEGETRRHSPYVANLTRFLTGLLEQTSADLIVVSMTKTPRTDDEAFARQLRSTLHESLRNRMVVLGGDHAPQMIKGIIGSADLFIGTRLHPTIFALSQAVPSLALHDQSKVRGFMRYCDMEPWLLSPIATAPETMVTTALRLLDQSGEVRKTLRRRLPALRESVGRNIEAVEIALPDEANFAAGRGNV